MQRWYRRYRVPILAALILGYALVYCCRGSFLPSVNPMEAQYNAIHNGMTVEEVEDILGKSTDPDLDGQRIWTGRGGVIIVQFDGRRVREKEFIPIEQPSKWPYGR